jgi:hypothetical protein
VDATVTPTVPYQVYMLEADQTQPFTIQIEDEAADGDFLWAAYQPYLYYFGGNNFRVFVKSTGDYSVLFKPFQVQSLAENLVGLVTVTYQNPMRAIRLDTTQGDVINISLEVVEGTGAQVSVYTEHDDWKGSFSILGPSSITDTVFPLSDTIEHAVTTDSDMVVIVQIPNEFTRSQVTMQVTWQRKP